MDYKAWHKIKEKWVTHDVVITKGLIYENYELFREWLPTEDIIILRPTTLTDKNEKKIYENDILVFQSQSFLDSLSNDPMHTSKCAIVWHEERLCWALQDRNGKYTTNLTLSGDDNQFEVIGNLMECEIF